MSFIVLSSDQARVVREAAGPVEVRDEGGEVLARILSPAEAAAVAESKRRLASGLPTYRMSDVTARLNKLAEISERETLDSARVKDLVRRMRAGEEV